MPESQKKMESGMPNNKLGENAKRNKRTGNTEKE